MEPSGWTKLTTVQLNSQAWNVTISVSTVLTHIVTIMSFPGGAMTTTVRGLSSDVFSSRPISFAGMWSFPSVSIHVKRSIRQIDVFR